MIDKSRLKELFMTIIFTDPKRNMYFKIFVTVIKIFEFKNFNKG